MEIYGSGGKAGGSVRSPREDSDTLRSKAYARFVDLISGGPIKGFVRPSDGVALSDCELYDSGQPTISGGVLTYSSSEFVIDIDGVITAKKIGGTSQPIFGHSSGYPLPLTPPLTTPKIQAIIEGDGTGAEIEVLISPQNTSATGTVRGIRLLSGGSNYTWVKVRIPPCVGQAIFLDNIALQRTDNLAFNFQDVRLAYRYGGASQAPLTGFEQVEEVIDDSSHYPLRYDDSIAGGPGWSLILTNKSYDYVSVDIELPNGFYIQDVSNGDILEVSGSNTVRYSITQQYKGVNDLAYGVEQSFGDRVFTLSGKTMSNYVRTIVGKLVKSPNSTVHSWKLNFRRLSLDDDNPAYENPSSRHTSFGIARVVGITDVRLRYPFCALVGIELNAEQFNSIPVRSYSVDLLILDVPSNYFPPGSIRADGSIRRFAEYNRRVSETGTVEEVRDTSGNLVEQPWDGTFYGAWSNNPAWVMYYVCKNKVYGLGKWLPGANKWTLYSIARYCDQLVNTGYSNGGFSAQEPRFTCNWYVQEAVDAYRFLSDLAGLFRSMVYWSGGEISVVQDSPKVVTHVFSPSNVVDGLFQYSSTDIKVRHTVATVFFNDPEDFYKLKPVIVEDAEGIRRYGYNVLELSDTGCTSRGQARRKANWALRSELDNTDQISFQVGNIGAQLRPGMIVAIHDPVRSGVQFSGRIVTKSADSAGRSIVTLDRRLSDADLEMAANSSYRFYATRPADFVYPADITSEEDLLELYKRCLTEEYAVLAFGVDPEGRTTINLTAALPPEVGSGQSWGLRSSMIYPQLFRLIGIDEVKPSVYEIAAIEYHAQIFNTIDSDAPYSESPITYDTEAWKRPGPPTGLTLFVNSKAEQGILVYTLTASWVPPTRSYVREYQVYIRKGLGNYKLETITTSTSVDFRIENPDNYCVQVRAVGVSGIKSTAVESCTVVGTITGENAEIISGLELTNRANETEFLESDAEFDWRVNWSEADSTYHTSESPVLPPGVQNYIVRILDPANSEAELLSRNVTTTNFTLTLETNRSLNGGPFRDFIIEVSARTINGAVSAPTKIRVNNQKPPVPAGLTVTASSEATVVINIPSPSSAADFGGYRVWMSEVADFEPSAENLVWQGSSNLITLGLSVGTTYYIRVAEFDTLSKNVLDCNISDQYTVTGARTPVLSALDFIRAL